MLHQVCLRNDKIDIAIRCWGFLSFITLFRNILNDLVFMLITKRSLHSRTYWIRTTCSHDTYQEPHILYQRMIQSHHQQQCSEQYALQSVAASCCCYAFAPDTSSRFVSWSIPSCFRKHFANLVGALFAFASIKCYAKFSSGMVAAYFFIGQHGFHFFLQSTRVNDRFL